MKPEARNLSTPLHGKLSKQFFVSFPWFLSLSLSLGFSTTQNPRIRQWPLTSGSNRAEYTGLVGTMKDLRVGGVRFSSSIPVVLLLVAVVLLCRVPQGGRVELAEATNKEWAPLTADEAKVDTMGSPTGTRKSQLSRFFGLNHFPGHALSANARMEMLKVGKLGDDGDYSQVNGDGYVDADSYRQTLVSKSHVEQVLDD